MSVNWIKNYVGFNLSDEEMRQIPYPMTELTMHVTMKTIQAFGLLGTVLAGPIVAVARKNTRNWTGIKAKMTRYGRGGLILGVVSGPLLTYARMRTVNDPDGAYDRCYRLRYNRNQVRVDQASFLCFIGGAGISSGMKGSAMFGGLVGLSSGIVLSAMYNSMISKEK
ncbi:hypothetical protein CHS0354_016105 [Potamilus streckersoni]|uniref:Uncharacterized protein n=1 Tax=Potamilus streckersoni TaxID=2493646 RepID=A0AAE0T1E1_9BIVA|nr:hypothetical protein CHS0354_016105 [Potamilus streckersoni]